MRTRLSVCRRKLRFASEAEAAAAVAGDAILFSYRCDRCAQVHLTSRTKGKRMRRGQGWSHPLRVLVPTS